VGPPLFGGRSHKPRLDEDGRLQWRMVLVYPESDQTDLVRRANRQAACWHRCRWADARAPRQVEVVGEDDTLAEFLDGMFGPDAPPLPWDRAGAYTRDALEVYYQADLAVPYNGEQLRSWLCEGTAAGVGAAAADDSGGVCDADAALAMRRAKPTLRMRVKDLDAPLRDVMAAPGHVLPSTLVLFVVARGTPGRERFLAGR
jgi:hypothetical protein